MWLVAGLLACTSVSAVARRLDKPAKMTGSYVHVDGLTPDAVPEEFTGINYFEELSLYATRRFSGRIQI